MRKCKRVTIFGNFNTYTSYPDDKLFNAYYMQFRPSWLYELKTEFGGYSPIIPLPLQLVPE